MKKSKNICDSILIAKGIVAIGKISHTIPDNAITQIAECINDLWGVFIPKQHINKKNPIPHKILIISVSDCSNDTIPSLKTTSRIVHTTIATTEIIRILFKSRLDSEVVISISEPKICAVSSGKVVVAKAGQTGYGNYVVIEHNSEDGTTFYTLYGHMKQGSLMVAEGTDVKVGQVLGIMGSTGNSTGAHLHFEIRINKNSSSNAVDPYTYLFGN